MKRVSGIFLICLILELMFSFSSWSWTSVANPDSNKSRLRSVKMVAADNGWAVGDRGVILHGEGSPFTWSVDSTISTTEYLLSIDMLSDGSDGWVVGTNGEILRWKVAQWNTFSSPTTETLWSVYVVNAATAYAVGNNCTILKWNGSSWSQVSLSLSDETMKKSLLSVYMTDDNNGWAVGSEGVILHCVAGSWSEASSPTDKTLWSVFMSTGSDGWVVGDDDAVLRYDGTDWAEELSASDNATLLEVEMFSDSLGWIVGGRCYAECDLGAGEEPECTLLKWNGSAWSKVSAPDDDKPARSVSIIDAANVWSVGNDGLIIQGP